MVWKNNESGIMTSEQECADTSHDFEDMVEMAHMAMVSTIALNVLKAATDEDYRDDIHRRQELREELGAPEWVPHVIEPYYNIATWHGRVGFFVGELSVKSPFNWYRYPILRTLASWSMNCECQTRWELHEDWPEVGITAGGNANEQ